MLHGVLNYSSPINRRHPLMRGCVCRLKVLPWYKSGQRLIDLSGFRNHCSFKNTPTWSGANRKGCFGSIRCDSAGEGADTIVNNTLKLNVPLTIACWIRAVGTPGPNSFIFGVQENNTDSVPYSSYALYTEGTFGNVSIAGNASGSFWNFPTGLVTSTLTSWSHLAMRITSGEAFFYLNGSQYYSAVGGYSTPSYSSTAVLAAGNYTGVSRNSNCELDDCIIWNRDIGASGVKRHYRLSQRQFDPTLNWMEDLRSDVQAAAGQPTRKRMGGVMGAYGGYQPGSGMMQWRHRQPGGLWLPETRMVG